LILLAVTSPSMVVVDDVPVEVTTGPKPATLRAQLHTPAGAPPFPALVFLHGCAGLGRRQEAWADELVREGYVVLVLDSFGPRGLTRVCGSRATFPGHDRAEDAFAAVRVLQRRPEVDRTRIGLIGWSHGGWTTLWTLAAQREHPGERVRAAIAFYPVCSDSRGWTDAPPLLMLLGGSDDWTPAERCTRLADLARGFGQRVETIVYPGAHHAFDDAGLRRPTRVRDALGGKGATIAYDADAHADARKQVRAFLARELKGTAHAPTGR
jgi:dienelactone hydrolase